MDAMPDGTQSELTPHEGQQAVLDSDARTRVVVKGRQWGGSTLIALDVVEKAIDQPGLEAWVFSPSLRQVRFVWEYAQDLSPPADAARSPLPELRFRNGSHIKFFSIEDPPLPSDAGVTNATPDYVAVDEADVITEEDWVRASTALETPDHYLFVGTPFGYSEETDEYPGSWLHDHFMDGFKSGTDTESWQFSTWSSPFTDDKYIEDYAEELDEGAVERNIEGRWP